MIFGDIQRKLVGGLTMRTFVILLILLMIATSVGGYAISRRASYQETHFGDFGRPDRVELIAWVNRIDTSTYTLSMTIRARPFGILADTNGNFAADATLLNSAVGNVKTRINKGDVPPDLDQRVGIVGTVTDYPIDHYSTFLDLHVLGPDGHELPTAITVLNTDPFFRASSSETDSPWGTSAIQFSARRSEPMQI